MDPLDQHPSTLTDLALQMLCAGVEWLREREVGSCHEGLKDE